MKTLKQKKLTCYMARKKNRPPHTSKASQAQRVTVHLASIGLGSNLSNPAKQIQHALAAIKQLPHCQFIACSTLYQSRALLQPGVTAPSLPLPDFTNAVAVIYTQLTPEELLGALHDIEESQGRFRFHPPAQRWGSRTIDLDILLYGCQVVRSQQLTIPHPEAHKRWFVAGPLLEAMIMTWELYKKGLLHIDE